MTVAISKAIPNSADGRMINMMWTIACSTGFAVSLSAPASAATAPRITWPSGLAANSAAAPAVRSAWAALKCDLARFGALPADWDGEDGIAPPAASVEAAKKFADKLMAAHIKLPDASVAGDGEIAFTWPTAKEFASVAFLSDGHLVAYSAVSGKAPVEIDEAFNDNLDLMSLFESLRGLV